MFNVINGNMLEELDKMEENSIGSIVTDPPYEINFMGKDWDNAGVAFSVETWKKCLRVLKPGGYLLSFAAPRTQHRIACAIEDAGFEIRDTVMWLYSNGFPKSMDISKQLDKYNEKFFSDRSYLAKHISESIEKVGKTVNDLRNRFDNSTKVNHWLARSQSNFYQPSEEEYEILVSEFGCSWDVYTYPAKRDVVGIKHKCLNNWGGKNNLVDRDITVQKTGLAKQWQGFGTALKPAYEPIIVARKPLCGTVADNVMTYGVGGINIDECRISHNEPLKLTNRKDRSGVIFTEENTGKSSYLNSNNHIASASPAGRFPSNVILTYDDSDYDEVCGGFPDSGSGNCETPYNYSDSSSRYFYCAKASKRDRDEGLDNLPTKQTVGGGGGIGDYEDDVNSCSGKFGSEKAPHKNFHPTVKPTSLMQYLVRLVTPKGETILDPFMGSGSTGKAAAYENNDRGANYSFIGIELNPEYCDIAQGRIEFAKNDKSKLVETKNKSDRNEETSRLKNKLF